MKYFEKAEARCITLAAGDPLSPEQYSDIAQLIYDTDPYIYPALFGEGSEGRSNAVRLISALLQSNADIMFAKKNLFVLCMGTEITGLILWYKGCMNWNPNALLQAADHMGIVLNRENVIKVSREYIDNRYTDSDADENQTLALINVCIKSDLRSCGAATYMMDCFLANHGKEKMELTVLADNTPAVNLYKKSGFFVVRESDGFSLSEPKPRCLSMKKNV